MPDPITDYLRSAILTPDTPCIRCLDSIPAIARPTIESMGALIVLLSHAQLLTPVVCAGVEYGPTYAAIQNAIYGTLQFNGLLPLICG